MDSRIYQTIPHRPPFLFVDEIIEVTETQARARRFIDPQEAYFAGHYPGNPIMPGVLLCEAVFQTAAVYMTERLRREAAGEDEAARRTPVLARIQDARFKSLVKPGDTVEIEATYKEAIGQFHFMKGRILRDGKAVMSVEFALAMVAEPPIAAQ